MKDYDVFKKWLSGVMDLICGTPKINYAKKALDKEMKMMYTKEKPKRKRARKADGTYKGDDKSTPNINEAWENE